MTEKPKVVIIGGGFGGLEAAKALGNKPVQITLIDRKNHHTFQPLAGFCINTKISKSFWAKPPVSIWKIES